MGCNKNHYELMQEQKSLVSDLQNDLLEKQRAKDYDNRPYYRKLAPDVPPLQVVRIDLNEDAATTANLMRKISLNAEIYGRMAMGDFVGIRVGGKESEHENPCESR